MLKLLDKLMATVLLFTGFFTTNCAPAYCLTATTIPPRNSVVLIATGGNDCISSRDCPRDVEFFSPGSDNFHKNGSQATGYSIASFGSVMVNNILYRVGGETAYLNVIDSFWAYNVTSDTWEDLIGFPEIIEYSVILELNGTIIALGGAYDSDYHGKFLALTTVYTYNLSNPDKYHDRWQKLPTVLPATGNFSSCAVVINETSIFYIVDTTGDMYRTDDGAQTWKRLSSMNVARTDPVCVALAGGHAILVAGGKNKSNSSILATVELYDISTNTWTMQNASMQKPRHKAAATVLPDTGNVVVCGGLTYNATGNGELSVASCEILDLKTNQWNITEFSMSWARHGFGLFVGQTL